MIRDATVEDSKRLTELSFAAKRHWNYPAEYYERWAEELTITAAYISGNLVRCKVIDTRVEGFYSVLSISRHITFSSGFMEPGDWLDHMFINPEHHRRGIGREFFADLDALIEQGKVRPPVRILVDPHAAGFYEKMGAMKFRVSGSSIPGREIPVYSYR